MISEQYVVGLELRIKELRAEIERIREERGLPGDLADRLRKKCYDESLIYTQLEGDILAWHEAQQK